MTGTHAGSWVMPHDRAIVPPGFSSDSQRRTAWRGRSRNWITLEASRTSTLPEPSGGSAASARSKVTFASPCWRTAAVA